MVQRVKGCPLLPQNDTNPSLCVEGESHGRTYFLACLKEKCAAFNDGVCGVSGTEVELNARTETTSGRLKQSEEE